MRIIQPHHPLHGQVVKVLRQARRSGSEEPCWLIETADGERQYVSQAWARPIDDKPAALSELPPDLPRVDVTTLRRLAIMVRQLSAGEEPDHDPTVRSCLTAAPDSAAACAGLNGAGLGATADRTPGASPSDSRPDAGASPSAGGRP